jgi:hypothetical protein
LEGYRSARGWLWSNYLTTKSTFFMNDEILMNTSIQFLLMWRCWKNIDFYSIEHIKKLVTISRIEIWKFLFSVVTYVTRASQGVTFWPMLPEFPVKPRSLGSVEVQFQISSRFVTNWGYCIGWKLPIHFNGKKFFFFYFNSCIVQVTCNLCNILCKILQALTSGENQKFV